MSRCINAGVAVVGSISGRSPCTLACARRCSAAAPEVASVQRWATEEVKGEAIGVVAAARLRTVDSAVIDL